MKKKQDVPEDQVASEVTMLINLGKTQINLTKQGDGNWTIQWSP